MKLLFEEISRKTCRYTITDSSWFPSEDEGYKFVAEAKITVSRRDNETVLVTGEIEGHRVVACDRCGEHLEDNLRCEFDYLATTRQEVASELQERECNDEDAKTLYLLEPEINVDEILREQTYLAMPLRTLCSQDCKGICSGCGVVLNSDSCCCSSDNSNSPFAVLGKLSNK